MSLLLFALVVLLLIALCVMVLRMVSPDANVTNIGSIILLLIGVVVICNRAGFL